MGFAFANTVAQIMWKLNEFVDKYVVMFFLPVVAFAEYTVGSWEIPMVPTIAFTVASVMISVTAVCASTGEVSRSAAVLNF